MKIFVYHAESEQSVLKHHSINALTTALRRIRLSEVGANQLKHQFKEVGDSLKILLVLEAEPIRSYVEPKISTIESEFESVAIQRLNFTNTHIVKFNQKYKNIPVYGAQITIEVDEKNELLAINSTIGDPNGINASPEVKPREIKHLIEENKGYKLADLELNPTLYYYYDSNKELWRLVYITDIRREEETDQLTKRELIQERDKSSKSESIPEMVDYIIDAHTREIVLELPRVRTFQKLLR